jgi:hypothetical protein
MHVHGTANRVHDNQGRDMKKILLIAIATISILCIAQAGDAKAPKQVTQIKEQIGKLQKQKRDAFLTIERKGQEAIVQVAGGKKNASLNITNFPSEDEPAKVFAKLGITIPKTWTQTGFEAKEFVGYEVPIAEIDKLPAFIHNLYLKLYKSKADYALDYSIETF